MILFLLMWSCTLNTFARSEGKLDSLLKVYQTQKYHDTDRVWLLHEIAWEYTYVNTDSAMRYGQLQLAEAKKINNYKKIGESYNTLGVISKNAGNFDDALSYYLKAKLIYLEKNDLYGLSATYNNLGSAYYFKGVYDKALNYYLNCLRINAEKKDSAQIARVCTNIGNVYYAQKQYAKARDYVLKALSIKLAMRAGGASIAGTQNNLAAIYESLGDKSTAIKFYNQALANYKKSSNHQGLAATYLNISSIFLTDMKENKRLDQMLDSAIILLEKMGDKGYLSQAYMQKGQTLEQRNNQSGAEKYLIKAKDLAEEIKSLSTLKDIYLSLSELYEKQNNKVAALNYFKKYAAAKDTLLNESVTNQLAEAEVKYETEKKEDQIKLLNQQNELADLRIIEKEAKINRKLYVEIGLSLLLVVICAFTFFLVRENKKKKQINKQLAQRNAEIQKQRNIIQKKNQDIVDSIQYGKQIQDALLQEEIVHSVQIPPHFILYKPKDIISGDFYWTAEKDNYWYICVADCTGHGVPGAMMSMLGIAFLNEIMAAQQSPLPSEVLDQLRAKIVKQLSRSARQDRLKDGMDISLARFDFDNMELKWAGANNPLWIVRRIEDINPETNTNMELVSIAPDKQPVGDFDLAKPFSSQTVQLHKGDIIYLFTDGYADQFGGPHGKKFKYRQLKEVIVKHAHLSMEEQKDCLNIAFENWKNTKQINRNNFEQIDDVCIIGIKV